MLGKTAQEVFEMQSDAARSHEAEAVFADALFKTMVVKCRVKDEMVNGESRVKSSIIKIDDIDYAAESKNMLDAIAKYPPSTFV